MEFQVGHLALFYHLLIVGFKYFCMGSLHNNIQLVLVFLEDPFLVLYVPYYTLMTFLMMLYVILLSMLTMQLSTLSVLRHSASFSWIYDCSHLTYDLNGLRSRVNKLRSFSEFFWIRFLSCFSSFLLLCFSSFLLFLVTQCLVVAFQPWIKSIRIKKKRISRLQKLHFFIIGLLTFIWGYIGIHYSMILTFWGCRMYSSTH